MSAPGPREVAFQSRVGTYLSDKPCIRGHIGLRRTSTHNCIPCQQERKKGKGEIERLSKILNISFNEAEYWRNRRDTETCQICSGTSKRMHIDHDHKTHRIRGILCSRCNVAIGMLFDNPELALKIIHYLGLE